MYSRGSHDPNVCDCHATTTQLSRKATAWRFPLLQTFASWCTTRIHNAIAFDSLLDASKKNKSGLTVLIRREVSEVVMFVRHGENFQSLMILSGNMKLNSNQTTFATNTPL
ncbi:hypothetical protein Y032_0004g1711 [Ancylostoma ceylanicum]|uniref:Uncharacterized protein n=1 Tax=Ancylostoma ceylanicum TaxID=53326 RepID=A0A016VUG8_9BILA|nr:hypothetical protein Y032_0004g1711 [Ancylostoma ceylanicum]